MEFFDASKKEESDGEETEDETEEEKLIEGGTAKIWCARHDGDESHSRRRERRRQRRRIKEGRDPSGERRARDEDSIDG